MNDETMLTNVEARQNVYLKKVYLWMALGLGVTALTAFLTASSPSIIRFIYSNPFVTISDSVPNTSSKCNSLPSPS